jgi:hypothetical protein
MSKARNLADLLDTNGDVVSAALDNVPPSNDASALTTGTLPIARIADGSITDEKFQSRKVSLISWNHAAGSVGTFNEEADIGSIDLGVVSGLTGNSVNVTGANIPSGLSLSNSGVLTGTLPNITATATSEFTVSVTIAGVTETRTFSITNTADNDAPTWNTSAGALALADGSGYSVTLSATDPEGGSLSYSIISGALPAGLSMSSAGAITGTASNLDGSTSSFTVRATDAAGAYADRSFSITAQSPYLYGSNHTEPDCTNAGGEVVDVGVKICRFTGASIGTAADYSFSANGSDYSGNFTNSSLPVYSGDVDCPSGWSQYSNWSTMAGCSSTQSRWNASLGQMKCGVPAASPSTVGSGNKCITDAATTYAVASRSWSDSTSRDSHYATNCNCDYGCDNGCQSTRWSGYDYFWHASCGSRTTTYVNVQARRSQIGCY